jgi:hypothetical protein
MHALAFSWHAGSERKEKSHDKPAGEIGELSTRMSFASHLLVDVMYNE